MRGAGIGCILRSQGRAWLRGTKPKPGTLYGDWVLSGPVTALDSARAHPDTYTRLVQLGFEDAQVVGLTVPLDELHLGVMWSEFEGCTFTQRKRRLMSSGAGAQGFFGHPRGPSVYRDCTFSRVHFGSLGMFRLWAATFERCLFDRCSWRSMEYDTDFIGCTFIGKMQGGAFGGTSPNTGRVNRIVDNDFSAADISRDNFGWRFQFPVEQQTWPPDFVPLQEVPR